MKLWWKDCTIYLLMLVEMGEFGRYVRVSIVKWSWCDSWIGISWYQCIDVLSCHLGRVWMPCYESNGLYFSFEWNLSGRKCVFNGAMSRSWIFSMDASLSFGCAFTISVVAIHLDAFQHVYSGQIGWRFNRVEVGNPLYLCTTTWDHETNVIDARL